MAAAGGALCGKGLGGLVSVEEQRGAHRPQKIEVDALQILGASVEEVTDRALAQRDFCAAPAVNQAAEGQRVEGEQGDDVGVD